MVGMGVRDVVKDWETSTDKKLVEELVRCFEESVMRKVKLDIALLEAMKPVMAVLLSVAYGASLSVNRGRDRMEVGVSFSTAEDTELVVDMIARIAEEMFSGRVMKEPSMMWKYKLNTDLGYAEATLCIGRIEEGVVEPEVRVVVCLR